MTEGNERRKADEGASYLRWVIPIVLVVAAGVGVLAVARLQPEVEALEPPKPVVVNVKTWKVEALPELADTFDASAIVEPNKVVAVAAEVSAQIEQIARRESDVVWRGRTFVAGSVLEEGQVVREGDPLVHLNTDLLQARYDRALAQHEYDEREYRRISGLLERGTTSKTELEDARTRRDIAKALLDEAARELDRATIRAPLDGILNRLPMEVGEFASPGSVVAEIVEIDRAKVVVDIPERDVHYVAVGQRAEVIVRAPDERTLMGEITYLSELADERTRTTRTEITVDNRDHQLRCGQIVTARLTRRILKDVIMIPLGSVIPLEIGRVVYVVDDEGKAARRTVELGLIRGRDVQVLGGLDVGEQLIVVGHRYVGPGQPVSVVKPVALQP
jgi:membrane fusion protein (multidrug efflux system)